MNFLNRLAALWAGVVLFVVTFPARLVGLLGLVLVLTLAGWKISGQSFGSFSADQPFLAGSGESCLFPQDDMQEYLITDVVNGLDGGCGGWLGPYVVGTFTNIGWQIWYVDAATTYTATNQTWFDVIEGGTNWIHVELRESHQVTETNWVGPYVWHTYTNIINDVWFADAMDEYTNTQPVTNLVGGTNWIFTYTTNNYTSSTNGPNAWTNLYAAKDY